MRYAVRACVVDPRQVKLAPGMCEETGPDGHRAYTVAQIAAEFGVSRATIYCHLDRGAVSVS